MIPTILKLLLIDFSRNIEQFKYQPGNKTKFTAISSTLINVLPSHVADNFQVSALNFFVELKLSNKLC